MLLLAQFDASNLALVEKLLGDGRLPYLAELRSRGLATPLERSTPLFVEAGGYVTTYSGIEVEEHGIYSAFQWSPSEQRLRFFDELPAPAAVWERLGRAGSRSLVVDQYESWIPRETRGLRMLNGWQFKHKLTSPFSTPRRANRALERRHGRPPTIEFPYGHPSRATLDRLTAAFQGAARRLADATTDLVREERFDLVWLTFGGPHQAGHFLWNGSGAQRSPLEDVYATVDEALGRILAALPDDADVIVFSPNGMTANQSRTDLLPGMLAAVLDGKARSRSEVGGGPGSWIWRLRGRAPAELRAALTRPLPPKVVRELTSRLHLRGVDWSRTRAFALPGDHSGYVRLNVRGRERDGVVDPAEADALMDEIVDGLASFRDLDGGPAIAEVHRIGREFGTSGRAGQLPDLVVRWSDRPSVTVEGVHSPRFGTVSRHGQGSGRLGNHTPEAWAVIAPGAARLRSPARPPRLTDIATTACTLLGGESAGLAGEALLQR